MGTDVCQEDVTKLQFSSLADSMPDTTTREEQHKVHGRDSRAIQMQDWKLVCPSDDRPWELYNLEIDIGGTDNLAADFPDCVRMMAAKYDTWRRRVNAR